MSKERDRVDLESEEAEHSLDVDKSGEWFKTNGLIKGFHTCVYSRQ